MAEEFNKIPKLQPIVLANAKKIMAKISLELVARIKKEYMTAGKETTDTALRVRSGGLRASVRPLPVTEAASGTLEAGVGFGKIYARVHVGPKGKTTTIRPKRTKFLAIPLPAAQSPAGVTRGTLKSGVYGDTFVRSAPGGPIVFGKVKGAGKNAQPVPLFLLRKKVVIPTRIHPEELIQWAVPRMMNEFKKIGVQLAER